MLLLVLIEVGQYSKDINSKLFISKFLYGFYSDMFSINGFQFSIVLVYSLKMVAGSCSQNSIFL